MTELKDGNQNIQRKFSFPTFFIFIYSHPAKTQPKKLNNSNGT